MKPLPPYLCRTPRVALACETTNPELAAAIELLRSTAEVLPADGVAEAELIVLPQSRAGEIAARVGDRIRQDNPHAGIIALLGTWCEGEPRTGRPLADVRRVYWYDFPHWWRRQLALRVAGECPDWARSEDVATPVIPNRAAGMITIKTTCWDTAETLSEVLRDAGYLPYLLRHEEMPPQREFAAGIWEGRQLDQREALQLTQFCDRLRKVGASALALLDYPRLDRCERARECGAAAVLGKPWQNAELVMAIEHVQTRSSERTAPARAA